ncbi:choline transporter-like protein 2 [Antedon mediterranea]|uniref:choline transporter-like protein 2 n=1 Tax=Antedon mediterranea TaxID=105859 RepID=UPI003AF9C25B
MSERRNSDSSNDDYGEPIAYDPNFTGPISNRKCTDMKCCLTFGLFVAGLGVISAIGFKKGNADILIYPIDYLNQVCGISEAVADRPYLFFFDYLECLEEAQPSTFECPGSGQVCVKNCPTENYAIKVKYSNQLDEQNVTDIDWNDFICEYDIDAEDEVEKGDATIQYLLDTKKCANYYTESEPLVDRCFPNFLTSEEWAGNDTTPNNRTITDDALDNAFKILDFYQRHERFNRTVEYLKQIIMPYMIVGITMPMLISLIYIVLIRYCVAFLVWSRIVMVYISMVFLTYSCWKERNCIKYKENDCISHSIEIDGYDELTNYVKMEKIWYITAIILSVITGIVTLLAIFLIKRIPIQILLIKEASKAVSSMPRPFIFPIILVVVQLAFLTYWCVSVVLISSISNSPYQITNARYYSQYSDGESCDPTEVYETADCVLVSVNLAPTYVYYFLAYSLVGLFWIVNFISSLEEMTLAGAFACHYWEFKTEPNGKSFPIVLSFWRCIRYHIGSLAFGSLVITIIQPIRRCVEIAVRQATDAQTAKFICKCCECCFCCCKGMLKYINRNAYVEIALHGQIFRVSGRNAFNLLMRNIEQNIILGGITGFMLFVDKLVITLGTVCVALLYFSNHVESSTDEILFFLELHYLAPILLMTLVAYMVADSFFAVYHMAIDTTFLCYLLDVERSGDKRTAERPNSKHLMDILDARERMKCCSNRIDPYMSESQKTIHEL